MKIRWKLIAAWAVGFYIWYGGQTLWEWVDPCIASLIGPASPSVVDGNWECAYGMRGM